MGFENITQSNPAESSNEQLSVKISHGNEIRRVTLPQTSYSSLVEHTATLFNLPHANITLKYEDDDGDKISMSSEIELREALRLAKETQKILRLFVELKAPKNEASEPTVVRDPRGIYFAPQGPKFGAKSLPVPPHHIHPLAGFPHPHPHPFPPGFSPADFHHPPHFAPSASYHVPRQTTITPTAPQSPSTPQGTFTVATQESPAHAHAHAHGTSTYAAPVGGSNSPISEAERGWNRSGVHYGPDHRHQYRRNHFHNSYYGPQSSFTTHSQSAGSWGDGCGFDRKAHKDSMHAMRDQWKEMKAEMKKNGNMTEEDKRKFKEMKAEMKNDMKYVKKDAILGMKAMKLSEKKQRLVARHVEDVTIPDGTELPPNTPFIKTWKIRNEGPAWPTGSQLLFVSHKGDNLNGPERVVIKGEVLPGQEVEVSVPLITPSEPGRYVGYYRMVTPDNVKFGQRVWVSFVVARPNGDNITAPNNNFSSNNNISSNINFSSNNTGSPELSRVCDSVDQ